MFDDDRLMCCVSAVADGAHTIECGDTEGGGEVAVGAAAGCCFLEDEAEFGGQGARFLKRAMVPALRSIGGRLMPPVMVSLQCGSESFEAAK